jgi:hydrogenase-4 component E
MSGSLFTQLLDLACGAFLLAAVVVLWRRELAAIVRLFALQGIALAAIALLLGLHEDRWDLIVVAAGIGALRAGLLPYLIRRALAALVIDRERGEEQAYTHSEEVRETQPLVNVAASLLTAAALTLLAYAVARPLVELDPTPATRALPVGLAVVLIGFFVLVTRRRALAQVVGFLLLDNGITATAFLAASGVPLIVELGVSFDVLLAVLVLQLLTVRVREAFGTTDIDDLRELHD